MKWDVLQKDAQIICSRISWRRIEGCHKKQEHNEAVGGVGVEPWAATGCGGGSGEARFALTSHTETHVYVRVKVMDGAVLRVSLINVGHDIKDSHNSKAFNITSTEGLTFIDWQECRGERTENSRNEYVQDFMFRS